MTAAFISSGVSQFALDGSDVWNAQDIRDALSNMTNGKCAYCEVRLGEGPVYLEVEHFYAKHHHPDRVLDWDNLLPACRRCNGKKRDWDVATPGQAMVDPANMAPNDHICLDEAYRPVGLTPEGNTTIIEIELDDIHRLGVLRYKLGETFRRKIEEYAELYAALPPGASVRQKRAVIQKN